MRLIPILIGLTLFPYGLFANDEPAPKHGNAWKAFAYWEAKNQRERDGLSGPVKCVTKEMILFESKKVLFIDRFEDKPAIIDSVSYYDRNGNRTGQRYYKPPGAKSDYHAGGFPQFHHWDLTMGRIEKRNRLWGQLREHTYDDCGRLKKIVLKWPDGRLLSQADYSYDDQGRITEVILNDDSEPVDEKAVYDYSNDGRSMTIRLKNYGVESFSTVTLSDDENGLTHEIFDNKKGIVKSVLPITFLFNDSGKIEKKIAPKTEPLVYSRETDRYGNWTHIVLFRKQPNGSKLPSMHYRRTIDYYQ